MPARGSGWRTEASSSLGASADPAAVKTTNKAGVPLASQELAAGPGAGGRMAPPGFSNGGRQARTPSSVQRLRALRRDRRPHHRQPRPGPEQASRDRPPTAALPCCCRAIWKPIAPAASCRSTPSSSRSRPARPSVGGAPTQIVD
jgi:hypothetical protein